VPRSRGVYRGGSSLYLGGRELLDPCHLAIAIWPRPAGAAGAMSIPRAGARCWAEPYSLGPPGMLFFFSQPAGPVGASTITNPWGMSVMRLPALCWPRTAGRRQGLSGVLLPIR